MKNMKKKVGKSRRVIGFILGGVACLLLILGIIAGIYISDYYHAADTVVASMQENALQEYENVNAIKVIWGEDEEIVLIPESPKAGIIFYPGGKVQQEAYFPLMKAMAEEGYVCILLKVTANLAIMDINAADGMKEKYQTISNLANEDWYLAGHSLGGAVASMYIEKHSEEYKGLLLFASYSSVDLSGYDLSVLSIYGTEDKVLNRESYTNNLTNVPVISEKIIEGGCHSYFGDYGMQEGDGNPTITREEQMKITSQYVDNFISENNY